MANLVRSRGWGQVKPLLGAQIDWAHPLAQGLANCFLLNGTPQDLTGEPSTVSSGTSSPFFTPLGMHFNGTWVSGTTTPESVYADAASPATPTQGQTLDAIFRIAGNTSGSINRFGSNDGADDTNRNKHRGVAFGVGNGTFDGSGTELIGLNENIAWAATGVSIPTSQFVHVVMVWNGESKTGYWYLNGRPVASTSWGNLAVGDTSPLEVRVGGYAVTNMSSSRTFTGDIITARHWNRAITPTEAAWLAVEPYAFIAPPGPKVLYVGFNAPAAVTDPTPLIVARSPSLRAPYGLSRPGRPAFSMLGDTTIITTAAISDTETGSGTDAGESIAAALNDPDAGTAADAETSLAVALTTAETGLAVDAGESITVAISDSDTASAVDAESSISLTDPDTGAAVDAGTIAATLADAETGSGLDAGEALAAALSTPETGTAVDAGESLAATLSDAETATAADTESLNTGASTTPSDTESGTGTENGAIAAALTDLETGAALDAGEALVVSISDSDSGSALDAEALAVTITDDDLMVFLESEAIAAALADADTGSADEDGSIVETIIVDAILPACVTLTVTDLGSVVLTVGDVPDGVELTVSDPWAVALTVGEC